MDLLRSVRIAVLAVPLTTVGCRSDEVHGASNRMDGSTVEQGTTPNAPSDSSTPSLGDGVATDGGTDGGSTVIDGAGAPSVPSTDGALPPVSPNACVVQSDAERNRYDGFRASFSKWYPRACGDGGACLAGECCFDSRECYPIPPPVGALWCDAVTSQTAINLWLSALSSGATQVVVCDANRPCGAQKCCFRHSHQDPSGICENVPDRP